MSCRNSQHGIDLAVRHRNAGVSWGGDRRADAGNDFKRDAGSLEGLRLFAAAAEHERVAAFEAHDDVTVSRARDHELFDLRLRHLVRAAALADVDAFAMYRRKRDDRIACECVVQ